MSYRQPQPMLSALAGDWWAFLVRGIAVVLFGLAVYFWASTLFGLIIVLFGSYALVDGILALVAGKRGSGAGRRWPLLVEGVLGVVACLVAGLVAFFYPDESYFGLLYLFAGWAIFTGILEMVMAISVRREIGPSFLMGFSGGLSLLFGVLVALVGVLVARLPEMGMDTLVFPLVSIYALIFGIVLITLGVRVRGHPQGSSRVS